jgi:hypothetical protein
MPGWWDEWGPLILAGAGVGANIIGAQQGSSAINQGNENLTGIQNRLLDMGEQERQRRDQLMRAILPSLARDMRNPRMLGGLGSIGARPSPLQFGSSSSGSSSGDEPRTDGNWGRWSDEDWAMQRRE